MRCHYFGVREETLGLLDVKLVSFLPKANVLINRFVKRLNYMYWGATVPDTVSGTIYMVMSNTGIAPALLELLQLLPQSLSS